MNEKQSKLAFFNTQLSTRKKKHPTSANLMSKICTKTHTSHFFSFSLPPFISISVFFFLHKHTISIMKKPWTKRKTEESLVCFPFSVYFLTRLPLLMVLDFVLLCKGWTTISTPSRWRSWVRYDDDPFFLPQPT